MLALFLFPPAATDAQSQVRAEEYNAEVGAFYTGIHVKGFGETINGLGGRFGYNINRYLAVDADASFMPERHLGNNQIGQKMQAFIGAKAGLHARYIGVFAKARPGVMSIGEVTSGFNCSGNGLATVCRPSHNNFALDAGGVVELYPRLAHDHTFRRWRHNSPHPQCDRSILIAPRTTSQHTTSIQLRLPILIVSAFHAREIRA